MQDRRDHSLMNWLRRDAWPAPMALAVAERVLPFAIGLYLLSVIVLATAPSVWGVIPAEPLLIAAAMAAFGSVMWLQLRPLLLALVFSVELGLSLTFVFVGASIPIPRSSELLAASIHGNIAVIYAAAHILAEFVRSLIRVDSDVGG